MPGNAGDCPKLSNKIILNPASILSAEVGAQPHGDGQPRSLEELRDVAAPQDTFYLIPGTGGFCAYPIRPLATPHFSLSDFFPAEMQGLPSLFGKPTNLAAPAEVPLDAAIYEPHANQIFVPEVRSLHWYLVGGAPEYRAFLHGIEEYTHSLMQEWRAGPWQFLNREWEPPETSQSFLAPTISTFEAWSSMGPFFDWLSQMDPALFSAIQGKLQYAAEVPDHECQSLGEEEAYAYYTPATDQILLMPPAIRLLQQNDYAGVAQILAHEVSHRENAQRNLVIPSDQLMQRSLELFFARSGAENPLFGMLTNYMGPQLWKELSCRRLPFLLEEEVDAHAKDLEYGRSRPFLVQSAKMHQESTESLEWYLEQLEKKFPGAWRSLAADYVALARARSQK